MPAFRQTSLFHLHERAGATLIEHHGWHVPAFFTGAQREAERLSNSAGLSDLSWMTKLDLKGYGLKVVPAVTGACALRLGPQHYLITCEPPMREAVTSGVVSFPGPRDLSFPPPVYVTDVTSVYAQFLLAGPRSYQILRKLTSLNVCAIENFGSGQATLAHVHSILLRRDLHSTPAFHLLVGREYGESIWQAVLHAGDEFQLEPFGSAALELVKGAA